MEEINEMLIKLNLVSKNPNFRFFGARIRLDIEEKFLITKKIVFDFTGIESVSESFADECVGKLLWKFEVSEILDKLHFKTNNHFLKDPFFVSLRKRHIEKSKEELIKLEARQEERSQE